MIASVKKVMTLIRMSFRVAPAKGGSAIVMGPERGITAALYFNTWDAKAAFTAQPQNSCRGQVWRWWLERGWERLQCCGGQPDPRSVRRRSRCPLIWVI